MKKKTKKTSDDSGDCFESGKSTTIEKKETAKSILDKLADSLYEDIAEIESTLENIKITCSDAKKYMSDGELHLAVDELQSGIPEYLHELKEIVDGM